MLNLSSLIAKFETAMSAVAFAEEGEFDTARQMLSPGKNAHKKVLLGIDAVEVDTKILRYALNLCKRVGAKLEVLQVLRPEELGETTKSIGLHAHQLCLSPLQNSLERMGIAYQPLLTNTSLVEELVSYIGKRRDIFCVVLEATQTEEKPSLSVKQRLVEEFEKLKCPVVTYGQPIEI